MRMSYNIPGKYLKCKMHNAYVVRGDYRRFVHVGASSKSHMCQSEIFIVVTIEVIDRDAAIKMADELKAKAETDA